MKTSRLSTDDLVVFTQDATDYIPSVSYSFSHSSKRMPAGTKIWDVCDFDRSNREAVLADLKAFYDGYHFVPGAEPLYNSTIWLARIRPSPPEANRL